jgi:hypothetical protein
MYLFLLVLTAVNLILDCKNFFIGWKRPLFYYLRIFNTVYVIMV